MIKYHIFVNNNLPVQTQRNKHQQKIFHLFKTYRTLSWEFFEKYKWAIFKKLLQMLF